jgi:hypothetical protein
MNGFNDCLIKQLPFHIQAAFPAVLTHQSGMSKELLKLMRPMFQHGIGPHRFHKIIRAIHMEKNMMKFN